MDKKMSLRSVVNRLLDEGGLRVGTKESSDDNAQPHEVLPGSPRAQRRALQAENNALRRQIENQNRTKLDYRTRVINFYTHYNPEKLSNVDQTLERAAGHEEELMESLVKKYGPEPTTNRAATQESTSSFLESALTQARLSEEITLITQQVADADLAVKKAEKKAMAFQAALDKSNADYKELSETAAADAKGRRESEARAAALQSQLEMMQQTVTALMDKVTTKAKEKEKTELDLTTVISKTAQVNESVYQELNEKTEQLSLALNQITELQQVMRKQQDEKTSVEKSIRTLASQVASLEGERNRLSARLVETEHAHEELTTRFQSLQQQHDEIQRDHTASSEMGLLLSREQERRERAEYVLFCTNLEVEDVRTNACWLYSNLVRERADLTALQSQCETLQQQLATANEAISRHEEEMEDQESQFKIKMRRQQNFTKDLQQQLTASKERVKELERSMVTPNVSPKAAERGGVLSDNSVPRSDLSMNDGLADTQSIIDNASSFSLQGEEQVGLITRMTELQETLWASEECKRAAELHIVRLVEEVRRKDLLLKEKFKVSAEEMAGGAGRATTPSTPWWKSITTDSNAEQHQQLHILLEHQTFETMRLESQQRRLDLQNGRLQKLLEKARAEGFVIEEEQ